MSFNFSLSFGHLAQTNTYSRNGEYSVPAQPNTPHISGNITVEFFPRWYKHIVVQWSIPADWGHCSFNVYFCPVEEGPFIKLNPAPINGTYLLDTTTQEYSKFDRGFYIVEAILLDRGGISIKSPSSSWDTFQRDWVTIRSVEIQRREWWLLTHFAGIKTYIFRRKNYGERCPECWSKKAEKVIKDNCKTCFGTSFKGGYFIPAPTYLQYDSTPNSNVKTYFGKMEPNQIQAWGIAFPEIRDDDIVFRVGDWSMYRVDAITPTELQGRTVRQILKLTQLSKGDIEYQLLAKGVPEFPTNYL